MNHVKKGNGAIPVGILVGGTAVCLWRERQRRGLCLERPNPVRGRQKQGDRCKAQDRAAAEAIATAIGVGVGRGRRAARAAA